MHKDLFVQKSELDNALSEWEYLQIILEVYDVLWKRQQDRLMENFSEEQISFYMYGLLLNQVENGGFLQLIFNGYTPFVFDSPLADALREWGAGSLADLLDNIEKDALAVDADFAAEEKTLDLLSQSYSKYPQFKEYDETFYQDNGVDAVKQYVESHLSAFIELI